MLTNQTCDFSIRVNEGVNQTWRSSSFRFVWAELALESKPDWGEWKGFKRSVWSNSEARSVVAGIWGCRAASSWPEWWLSPSTQKTGWRWNTHLWETNKNTVMSISIWILSNICSCWTCTAIVCSQTLSHTAHKTGKEFHDLSRSNLIGWLYAISRS